MLNERVQPNDGDDGVKADTLPYEAKWSEQSSISNMLSWQYSYIDRTSSGMMVSRGVEDDMGMSVVVVVCVVVIGVRVVLDRLSGILLVPTRRCVGSARTVCTDRSSCKSSCGGASVHLSATVERGNNGWIQAMG